MTDKKMEKLRQQLTLEMENENWICSRVLKASRRLDKSILSYYKSDKYKRKYKEVCK